MTKDELIAKYEDKVNKIILDDLRSLDTGYTEVEIRAAMKSAEFGGAEKLLDREIDIVLAELKRPTQPWYTKLPVNTPIECRYDSDTTWMIWYAQGDHATTGRDAAYSARSWDKFEDIRMPEQPWWTEEWVSVWEDGVVMLEDEAAAKRSSKDSECLHIYRRSDHE